MCGLVGAFKPRGECTSDVLIATMRDRMVHRGPDGSGLWRSPTGDCSFGHRRLSIIDLSDAASQPMLNQSGTVSIVFNGEIYNHAEVRHELETLNKYTWRTDHSDTEVLLHAYEEWGLDCFRKFCGMWGVAIYDNRDQGRPVVHLARDRVGIKPIYFTRTTIGEWLFASEIRALLAHPHVPAEMDPLAFWHYLTFIVAPAPLTMFRGIFKLPPATMVTIDHTGRATSQRYWDCKPSAERTFSEKELSYEDALAETERLLRQSIRRRMVSDVPFGVLLSGGVDSSLNVALMSELMDRPVTTFTIGYETHEEFNEFDHARRIAARYKTDHHETRISSVQALEFLPLLVELQDEPIADNVCIPLYFLAGLVRQSGTTVVQVGEGADENWLGYWWCEHYRKKEVEVYAPARKAARSWIPSRGGRGLAEYGRHGDPAPGESWSGAVLGRRRLLVGRIARAAHARSESVCDDRQLPGRGASPGIAHALGQPRGGQGLHRRTDRSGCRPRGDAEDPLHGNEAAHPGAPSYARRQDDHGAFDRGPRTVPRP